MANGGSVQKPLRERLDAIPVRQAHMDKLSRASDLLQKAGDLLAAADEVGMVADIGRVQRAIKTRYDELVVF